MKRSRKQILVYELRFAAAQLGVTGLILWTTPWSPFWVIVTVATAVWALRSWLDSRRRRSQRDVEVPPGTERGRAPGAAQAPTTSSPPR